MIREFSVKAKPSNNNAKIVFAILLVLAAVLVLVYSVIDLYRGIIGVIALAAIAAAVLIYTKYISSIYYYDVTFDYRGEPIFVVRQQTGKRQSTLARIGLADVSSIEFEESSATEKHVTKRGYVKYAYLPTLLPKRFCRLTAVSRYEKAEILVEISDELADLLRTYSDEARQLIISDYDE